MIQNSQLSKSTYCSTIAIYASESLWTSLPRKCKMYLCVELNTTVTKIMLTIRQHLFTFHSILKAIFKQPQKIMQTSIGISHKKF